MKICCANGCRNSPSKNSVGLSFHKFPVNKELQNAWLKAIERKNWQPSKWSILCSEHFSEDQLIKKQERVRLKPGAVPNCFNSSPTLKLCEQQKQIKRCTSLPSPCLKNPYIKYRRKLTGKLTQRQSAINSKRKHLRWQNPVKCKAIKFLNKSKSSQKTLFNKLWKYPGILTLPENWSRYVSSGEEKWIGFSIFDSKAENGSLIPYHIKDIIITQDLRIKCSVFGRYIDSDLLSLPKKRITKIKDVEAALKNFDRVHVCDGVSSLPVLSGIEDKPVFIDPSGVWRHVNCPLVVNTFQCELCYWVKKLCPTQTDLLTHKVHENFKVCLQPSNYIYSENLGVYRKIKTDTEELVITLRRCLIEAELKTEAFLSKYCLENI